MRVRVSQNWASKGWGGMVIPRIGMEVIVEHLRGEASDEIAGTTGSLTIFLVKSTTRIHNTARRHSSTST